MKTSPVLLFDSVTNTPPIEILLPARSEKATIERCLESIRSQTCKTFSVTMVDNNSDDETVEIALKFLKSNNIPARVYRFDKTVQLVTSLNFLLSNCQAKYAKFVFADDKISPNCLAKMFAEMENDAEVVLSYCKREYFSSEGHEYELSRSKWISSSGADENVIASLIYLGNHIGEPTAVMMRCETVSKHNILFDEKYRQLLDVELWIKLSQFGKFLKVNSTKVQISKERPGQTEQNLSSMRIVQENYQLKQQYASKLSKNVTFYMRIIRAQLTLFRVTRALSFRLKRRLTPKFFA